MYIKFSFSLMLYSVKEVYKEVYKLWDFKSFNWDGKNIDYVDYLYEFMTYKSFPSEKFL